MKRFTFSYRYRFFNILLIAIAYQTGELFSQLEDPYYRNYPAQAISKAEYYPFSNEGQMLEGRSQDQVQEIIYPDHSSNIDYPIDIDSLPYYEPSNTQFIGEDHWNEHLLPTSNGSRQSTFDIDSLPYYEHNEMQNFVETPQKEQFQVNSHNQWQSERDFTPYPPPRETEAEKENFINFDPLLFEAPDKIQHPLTKEGEATSYHFTDEETKSPQVSHRYQDNEIKKNQVAENVKQQERDQEESLLSLSEGKNINSRSNPTSEPNSKDVPTDQVLPPDNLTAQATAPRIGSPLSSDSNQEGTRIAHKPLKEVSVNFNNVSMIEYIRFISRISNKNFIFDDEDLQFNVTIVSEEPTTVENFMAALLQELRIRDLSLIEQGNNIIIHRNSHVRAPGRIVADGTELISAKNSELVTRVFRLNTLDPTKASEIIRPLLSEDALVEVLKDTNNVIITDLVTNVNKIAQLIGTLDAPNSGVTIGQYVVRNAFVDSLVDLATKILQPIAQGNPFVLVPHPVSNSIFIVSNSFIVEKALAILQNLDLNEGRTKILSLETLQPTYSPPSEGKGTTTRPGSSPGLLPFRPSGQTPGGIAPGGQIPGGIQPGGLPPSPESFPESFPLGGISAEGRPIPPVIPGAGVPPPPYPFGPGGIGVEGRPSAIFDETRDFLPGGIGATSRWARELPVGHIERTLFFIYKLRYRKGDNIELALRKIAASLQLIGTANADLISAINSSQWIESSNALIFTGTAAALEKVRELIMEVDVPLRQVFIEMLILNTTITDSLTYSVDWINRFGGGTTTGEQGFIDPAAFVGAAPGEANFLAETEVIAGTSICPPALACPLPVATGFLSPGGFAAGIIGTHLTHNGTRFSTIGALVNALHTDSKAEIVLNPKIITEDNNPAEIFVGGVDRYKTQSITNDLGSLVTNNFQFIDVGTTLRVTPLIGNNNIITLEIVQETTENDPAQNSPLFNNNSNVNIVPVLTKTRTVTKVHVPNGFFVVLSGMINDSETRSYARIPCLGGIPIIGAFGKTQSSADTKRNLMLFIRPFIIDNDADFEDITRRQQDIYREKSKMRRSWNYEIDEALNFANIKPTDPDEMNCSEREKR